MCLGWQCRSCGKWELDWAWQDGTSGNVGMSEWQRGGRLIASKMAPASVLREISNRPLPFCYSEEYSTHLPHTWPRYFSSFCLWVGTHSKWVCVWALQEQNLFPTALWLLQTLAPLVFKASCFGGSPFRCRSHRLGVPNVGPECLGPQSGAMHSWEPSSSRVTALELGGLARPLLCPSYPFHVALFIFCPVLWKICSSSFQVLWGENCSKCGCNFDVSLGGGELRIFLSCHLGSFPFWQHFLSKFLLKYNICTENCTAQIISSSLMNFHKVHTFT